MADNMDIDSPSDSQPLKSRDRIVRGLAHFGVPDEQLEQPGLVAFVKDKRESISELRKEMVVPLVEENASNREKSESKGEIPLCELLDLEIRWPSEAERTSESGNSDSAPF